MTGSVGSGDVGRVEPEAITRGDQVPALEKPPADRPETDDPTALCRLADGRPGRIEDHDDLEIIGRLGRRLRREAQRPTRVVRHAAEDIHSGVRARQSRYARP